MTNLQIEEELAKTLHQLAVSENLSVDALLHLLIDHYRVEKGVELTTTPVSNEGWRTEALDRFIGMFDDDVQDLSESVHESVTNTLRKKHDGLS